MIIKRSYLSRGELQVQILPAKFWHRRDSLKECCLNHGCIWKISTRNWWYRSIKIIFWCLLNIWTYMAITGSTSHGSGTSMFIVSVFDSGIFAKKALGPCTEWSVLLKSSYRSSGYALLKVINVTILIIRYMLPYHRWKNKSVEVF